MGALKSMILTVLGLLTPQDLKQLTSNGRSVALKKAAGAEKQFWEEEEEIVAEEIQATVLAFPTREEPNTGVAAREFNVEQTPLEAIGILSSAKQAELRKAAQEAYEKSKPDTLDFMLTERDKFRDAEERIYKQTGLASYRRNSDLRLYRVTVTDEEGKEKTKVTCTQGILINKKQA